MEKIVRESLFEGEAPDNIKRVVDKALKAFTDITETLTQKEEYNMAVRLMIAELSSDLYGSSDPGTIRKEKTYYY